MVLQEDGVSEQETSGDTKWGGNVRREKKVGEQYLLCVVGTRR